MPAYLFECDKCQTHKEVFRDMKDAAKPVRCSKCKKSMYRDFSSEMRTGSEVITIWKKPKICEASGCHKKQVAAEREVIRRHGISGAEVLDDGRMKYHTPNAEKNYLRLYNMHNRDGN